jgi:hypothetical protein
LAGFHEVGDQRPVVVFDERSERHRQLEVVTVPAMA